MKKSSDDENMGFFVGEETDNSNNPPYNTGDRVTTSYYPKQKDVVRKVIRCYPSKGHSQTGWMVDATGVPTGLDSGWFRRSK